MVGRRPIFFLAVFLLLMVCSSALAQETGSCDVAIESAYATAVAACPNLEPNQACYGNPLVEAELSDPALAFAAPGDVVDISAIESLALSPEDPTAGTGGIVYLRLSDEDTGADIYAVLYGNITLLPEEEGGFTVETPEPPEDCTPVASGLLLYSSGDTPARLVLNGVALELLAGTAYVTSAEDGALTINLLEGSAEITSNDEAVSLEAGESTTITLDEAGIADSVPSEAEALVEIALGVPEELLDSLAAYSEGGTDNFMTFTPPDTVIVPTAGTWYVESIYVSPVPVCPNGGFIQGIERQPPPTPQTAEFDFSDGVSLESFVEQLTGSVPPATFDNPAPNVYTALDSANDIEVALYIMSETEMVFTTIHSQVGCREQSVNWWMLQEG